MFTFDTMNADWLRRLGFAPKIEDYEPTVILLHYPALIRSATNKPEHYILKSSISISFTLGHHVPYPKELVDMLAFTRFTSPNLKLRSSVWRQPLKYLFSIAAGIRCPFRHTSGLDERRLI